MLIRCQRCQALFSLQDSAAGGAARFQVECGRCRAVFEAAAPRKTDPAAKTETAPELDAAKVDAAPKADAALEVEEASPAALPPLPVQTPVAPVAPPSAPGVAERQVAPEDLIRALRPRRPAIEGPPPKPKRRGLAWAVGAAGLILVVLAGFATRARLRALPREARVRLEQAREKLLRDDTPSLELATRLFTEAARIAPGEARPEAERAFALLLQAATHQDLAARLEMAAKDPSHAAEAEKLAQERGQHARLATRRLQEGLAAARLALEDDPADAVALRALALHAALSGAPEKGAQPLEEAGKAAPQDPWVAYTRAALALAGPSSRERQDRALAALAQARQAEPRLLRARVESAAISVDRQEPGPARAALTQVLAENPEHDRARRILSLLPAP